MSMVWSKRLHKFCFSMNAAEMPGCYTRFDWSFGKLLPGNECTETTATVCHDLRTEFMATRNKSNTLASSLIWIYYLEIYTLGVFTRSSERATMTTLAVITCLICLVCKIISLIHYCKGPINVGPVMSDCVLCAFTDIINAKEHFVGELVAWRETKQVRPSKTAGCPCALSGFKCSSAGPGGSWQDSIHTFFIEISQSKSHLCFRTKGESEVVSQCWELVTFHVVDF